MIDKSVFCSLILTYKSGRSRCVNAYGGRTYDDAVKIGEEYKKSHNKVARVDVYRYGFDINNLIYSNKFINE